MKNERRRTQELNTLSAYLDEALSDSEKRELEARLKQEPALGKRLENLRRTKILLGQLTRVRAPRNFTLTPDMVTVRRKKQPPLFTTLRLASSLAAILLVVLFGVELAVGGGLRTVPLAGSEPMMEAASVDDEATPEPLILWAEPGLGGGGDERVANGMGSAEEFAIEEPMVEIEAAPPEAETEEEAQPKDPPMTEPNRETMPSEPDQAESSTIEQQAVEDQDIILGVNPDDGGKIIDRSEPGIPAEERTPTWPSVIRWLQIALAVIAIGGGLTLWILRHRRRSLYLI